MIGPGRRPSRLARRKKAARAPQGDGYESLGAARSQKDLDRLFLGVAQKFRQAAFLTDAGVLVAAVGRALEVVAHAVDPDYAGLHPARGLERARSVARPQRRREPVLDRVGKLDDRVLVAPREHR